jgi:hypothetical protein
MLGLRSTVHIIYLFPPTAANEHMVNCFNLLAFLRIDADSGLGPWTLLTVRAFSAGVKSTG